MTSDSLNLRDPVEVSCIVTSVGGAEVEFLAFADEVLELLLACKPVGGQNHPNFYELEAQRALVRFSFQTGYDPHLRDDHWNRTAGVFIRLFEHGRGAIRLKGRRLSFADVTKEEWREGDHPMASTGGFLYRDPSGEVIYKMWTWIS